MNALQLLNYYRYSNNGGIIRKIQVIVDVIKSLKYLNKTSNCCVVDIQTDEIVLKENHKITLHKLFKIVNLGITKILVK